MGANWFLYKSLECGDIVMESGGHTATHWRHQYTAVEEQVAHTPA